jgi:hypothetical protein
LSLRSSSSRRRSLRGLEISVLPNRSAWYETPHR